MYSTDTRGRRGYGNPAYRRESALPIRPSVFDALLLIVLAAIGAIFLWRQINRAHDGSQAWAEVLALQLMQAIVAAVHGAIVNRAR